MLFGGTLILRIESSFLEKMDRYIRFQIEIMIT